RIPIQFIIIFFIAFLALTSILTFNKKIDVTDGDIGFRTVSFIPESTENGIECDFNKFDGVRKIYEFTAKEGDIINIKYQSNNLKMDILDGKNNIIQDFDVNEEYDVDLTFKEPSEYSINIYGKGNNGNFKIEL